VPSMNPDGLAAGTRTNAHGVDLNRNFPGADWRLQDAGTRYWSGPDAASERETRAMVRFLGDLAPHTVVSIHQPLSCVDLSGGDRSVTTWLADRLNLPVRRLGASGGNLTSWFNDTSQRDTAVTLELAPTVTGERVTRVADVLVKHAAYRAR
jgi:protein MpaA